MTRRTITPLGRYSVAIMPLVISTAIVAGAPLGCSEDDSETAATVPTEVRDFAERMSITACKALADCCERASYAAKEEECSRVVLSALRFYYSANVELASNKTAACLTSLKKQLSQCAGPFPPDMSDCRAALPGTVPIGEACSFDFECAPVSKKAVICANNLCKATPPAAADEAPPEGQWGDSCTGNGDCQGTCTGDLCVPRSLARICTGETLPLGTSSTMPGTCLEGEPCPSDDEECVADPLGGMPECQPAGGENMPCHADSTCNSDELTCFNQLCVVAGADSQPCRTDDSCDEGLGCQDNMSRCALDFRTGSSICCLPAGGEGEACAEGNTCNEGLECREDPSNCSGMPTGAVMTCCLPVGDEGELCAEGNTCNEGLACVEDYNVCSHLDYATTTYTCCVPAGAENRPCNTDHTCNKGLDCIDELCVLAGGEYEPCRADESCDNGLECREDPSTCPSMSSAGSSLCCLAVGAEGEFCADGDTCNEGLACVEDYAHCSRVDYAAGAYQCCIASGATDQPCNTDGTCDDGLECLSNLCVMAGAENEPCLADNSCNAGLECTIDSDNCTYRYDPNGADPYQCCRPVGDNGEPCPTTGNCNEGLTCAAHADCTGPSAWELASCCLPVGEAGQPCTKAGTCAGSPLRCLEVWSDNGYSYYECVPSGGANQPCLADQTCDAGYACQVGGGTCGQNACCVESGDLGGPCNANGTCNTDTLTCDEYDLTCIPLGTARQIRTTPWNHGGQL